MKTQVYYDAIAQYMNTGDQLIIRNLLNQTRPYGEIIVNDLTTPAWFIDVICDPVDIRFSNISSNRFYSGIFKRLLKQKISGEHIRSFILLSPGHFSRRGLKLATSIFKLYLRLIVLRCLGCKVIRVGFSIGPFDALNGWMESITTWVYAFYGVRDFTSATLAKRYHFSHLNYIPDMAWSFVPAKNLTPCKYNNYVVISFRSNAYGAEHSSDYLQTIAEKLHHLISSCKLANCKLIISYQVESDRLASLYLFNHLKADFDTELLDKLLTIEDASSLYASSYCVISNRLHVLLLASQNKTLAIPYVNSEDNIKITSIFNDNQLGQFLIYSDHSSEERLHKLNKQLMNREAVIAQFKNASQENIKLTEQAFASIFNLMSS